MQRARANPSSGRVDGSKSAAQLRCSPSPLKHKEQRSPLSIQTWLCRKTRQWHLCRLLCQLQRKPKEERFVRICLSKVSTPLAICTQTAPQRCWRARLWHETNHGKDSCQPNTCKQNDGMLAMNEDDKKGCCNSFEVGEGAEPAKHAHTLVWCGAIVYPEPEQHWARNHCRNHQGGKKVDGHICIGNAQKGQCRHLWANEGEDKQWTTAEMVSCTSNDGNAK